MNLIIVSPECTVYQGEVSSVTLPGTSGAFEVLDNHAPLISSLKTGEVIIKDAEGEKKIGILSGFVEVANNEVSICVEQSAQKK